MLQESLMKPVNRFDCRFMMDSLHFFFIRYKKRTLQQTKTIEWSRCFGSLTFEHHWIDFVVVFIFRFKNLSLQHQWKLPHLNRKLRQLHRF